jgi:hypothetical protein
MTSGYVPPRDDHDDNGPGQIRDVTPGQLTAKIQFGHRCYKVDQGQGEKRRSARSRPLFPLEAAKRAVDAPEAMVMLRAWRG